MTSKLTTAFINSKIFNFTKHTILDEQNHVLLEIKPKLAFNPIFYFVKSGQIVYIGKMKISKKIVTKQFDVYRNGVNSNNKIATIQEVPIYKKKSLFSEFYIEVEGKTYYAQYTIAARKFNIIDDKNNISVEGELITPFLKKIFGIRKYKVNIYDENIEFDLWLAITKGIDLLE